MPVNLLPVPVADLLREVLPAQATLARNKRIRLESDLPANLPPVRADIVLIQRVLQNLIGNALKFTPEGGCVRVAAHLSIEEAATAEVVISVRDNGPGIPPEIQSQLFQKFVTGGREEQGSGLGLAFCKLAVEAHGQRIWVESVPGTGAVFAFTLAVAK